jgi:rod shape-determining protein MreD
VSRRPVQVALKVLVVLVAGVLAQTVFGADLRAHEVAPDFMLLLAVAAGFVGGADQGAVVGFASGLVSDLFLQSTPFGLSALAFCLVGFAVGWAQGNLLHNRLLFAPAVAAAGTAAGVVLFVVIGYVVGQQQLVAPGKTWLVEQAVFEAFWAAVWALPAVLATAWALRSPAGPPGAITGSIGGTADLSSLRNGAGPSARPRPRPRAGVR